MFSCAMAFLLSLATPPAWGVATGHADLEHQVEALETLLEASMVLEAYAKTHGSYPPATGWHNLLETVLLPAGLPDLSPQDPWGHEYLYLASHDRQACVVASSGADGRWEGGTGSLEQLLASATPPDSPPRDAPEGDLLLFRSLDSRCPRHCGFLRSPSWAGRTWGGAQERGNLTPPSGASPTTDGHSPTPRRDPTGAGSAVGRGWCLAGEAAETWLALRVRPGTRSPERARLTRQHGPVQTTGKVRVRRTDLWAEVESPLGSGWVRARYLGACPGATLPRQGAAELFEVDRLLGSTTAALSGTRKDHLDAVLPARGLILLHGDRRESRDAAALVEELAANPPLREQMRAATWAVGPPCLLKGLGEATPVRDEISGLVLWFRRDEGRVALVVLERGEGAATDPETTGNGPDDHGEENLAPERAERES